MSSPEVQNTLDQIIEAFRNRSSDETRILLASLRPAEAANVLESLPPGARSIVWHLLDEETQNLTLQHLHEEVLGERLEEMDTAQLVAAGDELDTDVFADILQQLPDSITEKVLDALDSRDRARVEAVLSYEEDTAGGLMNTDS